METYSILNTPLYIILLKNIEYNNIFNIFTIFEALQKRTNIYYKIEYQIPMFIYTVESMYEPVPSIPFFI